MTGDISEASSSGGQAYLKLLLNEARHDTAKHKNEDINSLQDERTTSSYSYGNSTGEKREAGVGDELSFVSENAANDFAKTLQTAIKDLGFKCELVDNGGVYSVHISMPPGFEGQDPAKMDPATLKEAQKAAKQEESLDIKADLKASYILQNEEQRASLLEIAATMAGHIVTSAGHVAGHVMDNQVSDSKDKNSSKDEEKDPSMLDREALMAKYVNRSSGHERGF